MKAELAVSFLKNNHMEFIALYFIGIILFVLMIQFNRIYVEMKKFNRKEDAKQEKTEVKKEVKKPDSDNEIVGKSRVAFLQPIQQQLNIPILSEPLETEQRVEQQEIEQDEVEVNLETIDVDESEFRQKYDASDDLSQGITFEQISHAVNALEGDNTTEVDRIKAGETFYNMSVDMLAFLNKQDNYLNKVEELIGVFIDASGKKIDINTEEFDVKNFIYT